MRNKISVLLFSSLVLLAACDHKDEHGHGHDHPKISTTETYNNIENAIKTTEHSHSKHSENSHDEKAETISLDAHEHGVAEMNISFFDNKLNIDLVSPAFNIVGFESQPNKEQKNLVSKTEMMMTSKANLPFLVVNKSCSTTTINLDSPFTDGHKDHEHKHEHKDNHEGETHSEYGVEYTLNCKADEKQLVLDFEPLFDLLPNMEKVNIAWLTANKQHSAILTKSNAKLAL